MVVQYQLSCDASGRAVFDFYVKVNNSEGVFDGMAA